MGYNRVMSDLQSVMKQHSRNQVEIKNHYPIDLSCKGRIKYDVDIFLFSPFTLNISNSTYRREEVLARTHIYTRYTIYETTLEELIREDNERSPLFRLEKLMDGAIPDDKDSIEQIYYEYRTFANAFLWQMDKREESLRKRVNDPSDVKIKPEVIKLYEALESVLTRFRALGKKIDMGKKDKRIAEGYALCDETISLSINRFLLPLLNLFNEAEGATGKKRIRNLLMNEAEYRKSHGYALLEEGHLGQNEKERYVYRESILKKWAQSVNYMDKKKSRVNNNTGQILAAIAAAVAMAFAVLATLSANRFFVTYSLPWIVIAVLSYSLKDRIKEGLRLLFKKLLPRLISDKTDNLYDTHINRRVGRARLTVEHRKEKNLPAPLLAWYRGGEDDFRSILPGENILQIKRQISLNKSRLIKYHTRLNSLTEVIRMDLNRFMRNMDDPKKTLWYLKESSPASEIGSRTYRLKFAVRLCRDGKEEKYSFYRVHLKQNGIIRIEELNS